MLSFLFFGNSIEIKYFHIQSITIMPILLAFWTLLFFQTPDPMQWIKQNLENYFAQYPNIPESTFCTPTYIAYKNDALLVDMDGGLTVPQFRQKWSTKFKTKYAGMSAGYFISGTDFGKINVTSCQFLKKDKSGTWWKVVIRDEDYQINYQRDILLIQEKETFKIADIKEYN